MYVATVALCSCGGCLNALFSVGEPLIALICDHNISFSTYLADHRSISPSDVVVATGGIRNQEELEIALEIARTTRKVIAVGSCAVYGGVCGFEKLTEMPTAGESSDLPPLLEEMLPLDSRIDIGLYVPGCPPPPNLIFEALKSVLEGYSPPHFDGTVCSECSRRVASGAVESWSRHPGAGAQSDSCLLNEGFICLGPVTRGGCHAICSVKGSVCIGCRGPSDMVVSSQLHSTFSDMVKYVSLTTGAKEQKTRMQFLSMLKSIYLFTRRDPVTRARVKEELPSD
jgi:F420-non-reducing hydrogenase small subunit